MGWGNAYDTMLREIKEHKTLKLKHFQTPISKEGMKRLKMLNVGSNHSYQLGYGLWMIFLSSLPFSLFSIILKVTVYNFVNSN